MKMNFLEKIAMDNFVRVWFLYRIEAPLLEKLGGNLENMNVVEIGCGSGITTEVILNRFKAGKVTAIDLDSEMIKRARKRLSKISPERLELKISNATCLEAKDNSFDAVVDFAALHHIPNWQSAVSEIYRVLKPGGRFYFEEVTKQWIKRWPYRVLFLHPVENRFSGKEFIVELERQAIIVGNNYVELCKGDFVFGVGYRK